MALLVAVLVILGLSSLSPAGIGNGAAASRGALSAPVGARHAPSVSAASHVRPSISSPGVWTNLTSIVNQAPGARYIAGMAYDSVDGYALMFGGSGGSGVDSDTWSYQAGTWTDLTGSLNLSPPKRYAPAMGYDPKDNETVMFGGYDAAGNYFADTWVYAHTNWTNLTSKLTTHPSARWRANMVYDAHDGYMVLFGGTDSSGNPLSDTWKFSGGKWSQLTVTGSPQGRYRFTMADDVADKKVVVFGGCTTTATNCATGSTWLYDNGSWTNSSPSGPSPRVYPQMAYDPQFSGVLLFGGSPESGTGLAMADTWVFSGGTWTNVTGVIGSAPPRRGYQMMTYDADEGYVLMFGGSVNPSGYLSDTWAFGPSVVAWASAAPAVIDIGQSTSLDVTAISSHATYTYTYTGLPTGCTSSNTSTLSCTPTALGPFKVHVNVTDSGGGTGFANLTVQVDPLPHVTSFTSQWAIVTKGVPTNFSTLATNGTGAYSFSYTGLPGGCSSANTPTLECVPAGTGSFTVQSKVTDSVGGSGTASIGLVVNPRTGLAGAFANPNAIDLGQSAVLTANATGGTVPYSYVWSALPGGCSSQNVSALSCHPNGLGSFAPVAHVSDVFGVAVAGALNLTVNPPPGLSSAGVAPGTVDAGGRITAYVNVTGGTLPYSYTYTNVPTGCTFLPGAVSTCNPTSTGPYSILVTVTDAAGMATNATLNGTVLADPSVSSFFSVPRAIDIGQPIRLGVTAAGGTTPYAYSYSGLPLGCTSENSPSLVCTPGATGTFPITASVTDAEKMVATSLLQLVVNHTLRIVSMVANPTSVAPGAPFSVVVQLADGTPPFSYIYSGLPSGCSSPNSSKLNCTTTATGVFSIVVTATDGTGVSAELNTSVTVAAPSTGSGSSNTVLGLSPTLAYGLIGAVVLLAVVALAVLMLRRRRAPPPEEPSEPDEA
ncbi:MAG: hypothetical protein L3K04_05565 [Thermoplasmata archaeon]|nr:hypothetical protein [Thermoplasmata archaeon]